MQNRIAEAACEHFQLALPACLRASLGQSTFSGYGWTAYCPVFVVGEAYLADHKVRKPPHPAPQASEGGICQAAMI
jgi:hypothetical protein